MNDVFVKLFLVCFVAIIFGLISPGLVLWFSHEKTRFRVIIRYGLGMVIFFILALPLSSPGNEALDRIKELDTQVESFNKKIDALENDKLCLIEEIELLTQHPYKRSAAAELYGPAISSATVPSVEFLGASSSSVTPTPTVTITPKVSPTKSKTKTKTPTPKKTKTPAPPTPKPTLKITATPTPKPKPTLTPTPEFKKPYTGFYYFTWKGPKYHTNPNCPGLQKYKAEGIEDMRSPPPGKIPCSVCIIE